MFEDDPSVLYFSVHRHDFGTFYPCAPDGSPGYVSLPCEISVCFWF